jgi:hypothetical protein
MIKWGIHKKITKEIVETLKIMEDSISVAHIGGCYE